MRADVAGWVELCTQHMIMGWTTAHSLQVYINGDLCGDAEVGELREDCVAEGICDARGFQFVFLSPLWLKDRVMLRLPDNRVIAPANGMSHHRRLNLLVSHFDLTKPGLEFGPLDQPTVPRKHADVYYVDHEDQESIERRYAHHLGGKTSKAQIIDYVWENGCSLNQLVQNRKFGWVVASHVAEHIADFIGWLQHIEDVLEVGGCLSMALPHGERTFDARRPVSTFEDIVASHIMKLDRPSPRQILGHMLGVADYWGTDLRHLDHEADLKGAIMVARHAHDGAYVDVHCNVFTPASFVACYELIHRCGFSRLKLDAVVETGDPEFFVRFVKIGAAGPEPPSLSADH